MMLLMEVFHEAGFPAGVVNLVTGSGAEIGDALVKSPLVDMVSMTGGTETGKNIIGVSKDTVKDHPRWSSAEKARTSCLTM